MALLIGNEDYSPPTVADHWRHLMNKVGDPDTADAPRAGVEEAAAA
jgi:hypothetical protein